MAESETVDPVTVLTMFNNNGQVTRKNHSHPAAYALLHVASEKIYVGSTEDLYTRVNNHRNRLKAGEHRNKNIQEAFNQDSRFELAFVQTETKEQAIEIEQRMLDIHMSSGRLLNISPNAQIACKGVLLSDQRKDEIRQKTIDQFSSQEARENHSKISKQLWECPEYRERQKLAIANIDIEQKSTRITESLKDKWQDPDYRSKMEADRQKRRKPITVDGTQYSSVKEASQIVDIPESTIISRIKNPSAKFAGYLYISKQEK